MDDEKRIIAAYRAMDARAKGQAIDHLEWLAKAHPCRESLRLVVSNGRVDQFRKPLGETK